MLVFFYGIRRRAAYHYIKIGEKEGPRGQYKTTHTTTPHRKLSATHAPVHMKRLRPKHNTSKRELLNTTATSN
jgi:hypothetical protein